MLEKMIYSVAILNIIKFSYKQLLKILILNFQFLTDSKHFI